MGRTGFRIRVGPQALVRGDFGLEQGLRDPAGGLLAPHGRFAPKRPLRSRGAGRGALPTAAPPGARSGGAARLEGGSGRPRSMPGDPGLCGPSIPASSPPGQRASVGLRPGPAGAARTPKRAPG
nr:collagen alpha-2(I) chain-like isoform X2 [Manis javanica]